MPATARYDMRIEIARQHTTIRANPGPQKFETRRKFPPSQAFESPGSLPEGGRLSGEGSLTKGLHASAVGLALVSFGARVLCFSRKKNTYSLNFALLSF